MTLTSEQMGGDSRVIGLLDRLEAVLDDENSRIGQDRSLDLNRTNAMKSRCLYEMTLLIRDGGELGGRHAQKLAAVREKLELNTRRISAHMDAVREVTMMLKDVATAAEADGTYSADQFKGYDF